jgi:polysaccharide deacetylase 2 family uncharacterized protein YibQ
VDDLHTPLTVPKPKRRRKLPVSGAQLMAGLFGTFLAVFLVWAMVVDDPLGGEPVAVASIAGGDAGKPGEPGAAAHSRYDGPSRAASDPAAAQDGGKTITIIDGSSGKRQQVVVSESEDQTVAQPAAGAAAVDERLLESTRHGQIPKVAAGGVRAVEAYASKAGATQAASKGPRIAIVVGGLGVGASITADALSRLPPAVTLAFIPHGANLPDLAARARSRGHEVLLQVAMEPFDYPDNDPGPQTLLTTLANEQNLDRLHWQMSRFQGYVGIMNLMGARFLTSEKALAPVLDHIAKRGLLFVDDGVSARSLTAPLAAANHMPFVRADVVLDAVPTPNEIDRALARLEAAARKQNVAVGVAGALPVSLDRIVHWAKTAETRGITLVPVTVAALKPRSS